MILDKKDLPDDPTPPDAPPSYDDLTRDGELQSISGPTGPGRFGRFWRFGDEKRGIGEVVGGGSSSAASASASASASSSSVTVPGPSRVGGQSYPFRSSSSSTSPTSQQQPNRPSKVTKQKSKQPAGLSWIANLTSSHRDAEAQKDVRATVLGLVRDLVQSAPTGGGSVAAEGILQSCQAACDGCALSLSDVLQERSIEGHTPLYWAIVKRPRNSRTDEDDRPRGSETDTMLHILLSHTAPLNASTLSELRLACLVTADNALLQRLRTDPAVVPRSGIEAMLHGTLSPSGSNSRENLVLVDEVEVFEDTGEEGDKVGAFMVKMKIRRFQRRMRVAGGVGVEFVARGRLWFLTFFIVPHPTQLTSLPSSDSYSNTNSQLPTTTSPPAHPLDPTHLAHASISHTLLTRAKLNNRRTNSAALGVGSWAVALGLMEHGAACYVDGRVKVDEWDWEREEESMRREREEKARREKERIEREERDLEEGEKVRLGKLIDVGLDDGMTIVSTSSGSTNVTPNHTGTSQQTTLPPHQTNQNQRRKRSKPKPTIVLTLRTPKDEQLTVSPAPIYSGDESSGRRRARDRELKEREREARMRTQVCAIAGFEESLMGGSLQFDGSTYIAPDETLHATLEAKLARPDAECVIC